MNFLQRRKLDIFHISSFLNDNNCFEIFDYINSSNASSYFYRKFNKFSKETDVENILNEYKIQLKSIVENLAKQEYSDKEIILNYLEYIRLTGMNENFDSSIYFSTISSSQNFNKYLQFLRQGPFNALLLGKGSSSSQTLLFKDLLRYTEFKEYIMRKSGIDFSENYDESDITIISRNPNDSNVTLNPAKYQGSLENFQTKRLYYFGFDDKHYALDIQLTDILNARNRVLEYLVKKHNMQSLKYRVGITDESTPNEKFDAIINYIKNNVIIEKNLDFGSIEFDNKEFECGKFFEILCYVCDIHIYFACNGEKQDTTYYGYSGKEINVFNFSILYDDWKKSKFGNSLNKKIGNGSV